ncbi:MAG: flagellar protein FlaG [Rhodocyclaceae bacterium]|nr:flagellar protein FlaG [Rhodocyclaceae bacterium]
MAAPVSPAAELGEVQRAASRAQEVLVGSASSLKFTVDDKTGTVVVRVVDTETDQLIRQIPSEEMLAIARNMEQMQGLLVRREA